jgi:threonine efflux protein
MSSEFFSPALAVALTAFTIGAASPGPGNMAIMGAAMSQGRRQAVALASGIVCGSLVWGLASALGLSALMHTYSWALVALKVLGGFYMLLLAWKAARAAMAPHTPELNSRVAAISKRRAFIGGLGMDLTKPKVIFVWLSIVALAIPPGASRHHAFGVVASCAVIDASVLFGYALAFSTTPARVIYSKAHRWLNAALSAMFAVAGVRLLLSRSAA